MGVDSSVMTPDEKKDESSKGDSYDSEITLHTAALKPRKKPTAQNCSVAALIKGAIYHENIR